MRIISGKYKGKKIDGFNILGTRPTQDRIKESLFGMIQSNLKDSIVLDLFAGSGSLGLEAISNGAKESYFVDNNKIVIDILKQNIKVININELITLLNKDYQEALLFFKDKIKFDIIFLDPPYDKKLIGPSLEKIIKYALLEKNGLIVCEYEKEVFNCELELIKQKKYGSKNIRIYKKL